jgi:5-methylcytosine-specific restriction endonuclease McrA
MFKKGCIPWNKGLKGFRKGHKPTYLAYGKDNHFYGKKHTKQTIEKMRNAKLGKKREPLSIQTKIKMRKSHLGKPCLKGDKSPHWKGGITSKNRLLRSSKEWKVWRSSVFLRDNFTCQKCEKRAIYLEPHHIIPVSECIKLNKIDLVFTTSNGITYCKDCHNQITFGGDSNFVQI